jgi:hypothetical protein
MKTTPLDLREHARQTKRRLILAGAALIVVLGAVLIAATYGTPAAGCGLAVIALAAIPVGLIVLVLWILQRAADRMDRNGS